jgi:hypothetical protein
VQLVGNVALAQLPSAVVTNGTTGVTLTGTFTGNGAGLTNLNSGSLAPGFGVVPPGGIVLSATASNTAFASAGFALVGNPLGAGWTQATNAAQWSGRNGFGAVVLNGQMWVMGGDNGSGLLNNVWSSSNGVTWTQATSAAPWSGRCRCGAVVLNGQMWVMGGFNGGVPGRMNDVWSSSNGVTWTQASSAAPWSGRYGFGAVAINGQMWVLGGTDNSPPPGGLNDVWSSSNGVTWAQATSAAPWSGRTDFGAVALNGQMWVLGGLTGSSYFNDVWSSSNGVTWTQASSAAPWSGRYGFGAVALNGQMWVIGGGNGSGLLNDVWSSSNGVTWTQATSAAPWSARGGFGAVALNGQMWVVGGGDLNDVWSSSNGVAATLGGFYLYQKQ